MTQRRSTFTVFDGYVSEVRRTITGSFAATGLVVSLYVLLQTLANGQTLNLQVVVSPLLSAVVLFMVLRRIKVILAANLLILIFLAALAILGSSAAIIGTSAVLLFSGAFIVSAPIFWLSVIAVIVRMLTFEAGQASFSILNSTFTYLPLIIFVSLVIYRFRVRLYRFLESTRRASANLESGLAISRQLSSEQDETELLQNAVKLIRQRFGYYQVQVFLQQGSSNEAALVASTGDLGTILLAENTSLPITTRNLVGRTLLTGEPITVRSATNRSDMLFVERLPNSVTELAVPLILNEQIIGVLDLHSTRSDVFNPEEVGVLQGVANALVLALMGSRFNTQQKQITLENSRIRQANETSLRDLERLNRQLTGQSWTEYVRDTGAVTGVTLSEQSFRPGAEWTPTMTQAVQQQHVVSSVMVNGQRQITVPIELRGEVVGVMELELPATAFARETVELLRLVSERLALSLDNARLFEESQETTLQEQRINDIVSGYQTADSIESLLQMTLEGLSDALGTQTSSIRLGNMNVQPVTTNGDRHD